MNSPTVAFVLGALQLVATLVIGIGVWCELYKLRLDKDRIFLRHPAAWGNDGPPVTFRRRNKL